MTAKKIPTGKKPVAKKHASVLRAPIPGTLPTMGNDALLRKDSDLVSTRLIEDHPAPPEDTREYTGKSVNYYKVDITNPTSLIDPYVAECNDIIEALNMTYAEGNQFKAIWRSCAARTLGLSKKGYTDLKYDAEKAVFFAERTLSDRIHKHQ